MRYKDGIPIAALLDIDEYEDYLDVRDQGLKQQIREGHREYRRGELTEDLDTFLTRIKAKPKKRAKSAWISTPRNRSIRLSTTSSTSARRSPRSSRFRSIHSPVNPGFHSQIIRPGPTAPPPIPAPER